MKKPNYNMNVLKPRESQSLEKLAADSPRTNHQHFGALQAQQPT